MAHGGACYAQCMAKSEHYSMRFDPDFKARLERAAAAEGRSVANLIEWVVSQYLAERERREGKRK